MKQLSSKTIVNYDIPMPSRIQRQFAVVIDDLHSLDAQAAFRESHKQYTVQTDINATIRRLSEASRDIVSYAIKDERYDVVLLLANTLSQSSALPHKMIAKVIAQHIEGLQGESSGSHLKSLAIDISKDVQSYTDRKLGTALIKPTAFAGLTLIAAIATLASVFTAGLLAPASIALLATTGMAMVGTAVITSKTHSLYKHVSQTEARAESWFNNLRAKTQLGRAPSLPEVPTATLGAGSGGNGDTAVKQITSVASLMNDTATNRTETPATTKSVYPDLGLYKNSFFADTAKASAPLLEGHEREVSQVRLVSTK